MKEIVCLQAFRIMAARHQFHRIDSGLLVTFAQVYMTEQDYDRHQHEGLMTTIMTVIGNENVYTKHVQPHTADTERMHVVVKL
jgi:hypothetical protein